MDMSGLLLVAAAAVVLVLLAVALVVLLSGASRSRRALAEARSETAELRARLDALSERLESTSAELVETREAAFLITDAGVEPPEPTVPDRVVLTATLGEPLVRVVALGHGVRRALSPEVRNRIWFEMRREVRRTRKQRRREMKDAWRRVRTEESAA